MRAVDKWVRMLIKQLLEFHRVMWKHKCDLIAQANDHMKIDNVKNCCHYVYFSKLTFMKFSRKTNITLIELRNLFLNPP